MRVGFIDAKTIGLLFLSICIGFLISYNDKLTVIPIIIITLIFLLYKPSSTRTYYFLLLTLPFVHQFLSASLVFVVWVQLLIEGRREKSTEVTINKAVRMLLYLFVVSIVLSFFNTVNFTKSVNELLQFITYITLFVVTIKVWPKLRFQTVKRIIYLALFILGCLFILRMNNIEYGFMDRINLIQTENFVAFIYSGVIVGFLIYGLKLRARIVSPLNICTLIFLLTVLYFTGSRGAILSIVATLTIVGLFKSWKILMWVAVSAALLIVNFEQLPVEYQRDMLSIFDTDSKFSNLERLRIWESTIQMFMQHPIIGNGVGTWYNLYQLPEYRNTLNIYPHAHQMYFQLLAEIGLCGTLLFLSISVYLIIKVMKSNKPEVIVIALTGVIISCLISGTYGYQMNNSKPAMFFWIILGILYSETRKQEINSEHITSKIGVLGQRSRNTIA